MTKVLLVIMNKDNADGLKKCLESLSEQTCKICSCFDVLIVDGGSKDNSRDIVKEFSRKYPCVKFLTQKFRGGVGPARIEAVRYAISNGYDAIVWGDSENIYDREYMEKLISRLENDQCDIVSGRSVVLDNGLWSRLFYWYHSFHVVFNDLKEIHAPGNNKVVKTQIYNYALYPPSVKSDDFYFSYLLLRKGILRNVRLCYEDKAICYVSMPKNLKEVISWQRSRVKGLVEGALITGAKVPPDFPPWLLYAIAPFIIALLAILGFTTYALLGLAIFLTPITYIFIRLNKLRRYIINSNSRVVPLLGVIGTYMHALLTLYYVIKYYITLTSRSGLIRSRALEILRYFSFRFEQVRISKK